MATLVTSPELELRIIFADTVPEVVEFLHATVASGDPLTLLIGDDREAYVVNFGNLAQFHIAEHDPDIDTLADDLPNIVISIAEVRLGAEG